MCLYANIYVYIYIYVTLSLRGLSLRNRLSAGARLRPQRRQRGHGDLGGVGNQSLRFLLGFRGSLGVCGVSALFRMFLFEALGFRIRRWGFKIKQATRMWG